MQLIKLIQSNRVKLKLMNLPRNLLSKMIQMMKMTLKLLPIILDDSDLEYGCDFSLYWLKF